jgi:hypothetical protein
MWEILLGEKILWWRKRKKVRCEQWEDECREM